MTLEQRQQSFLDALEALTKEHGLALAAQVTHDQVAPAVWERVEAAMKLVGAQPQVVLVPVEGWTPPADSQEKA